MIDNVEAVNKSEKLADQPAKQGRKKQEKRKQKLMVRKQKLEEKAQKLLAEAKKTAAKYQQLVDSEVGRVMILRSRLY